MKTTILLAGMIAAASFAQAGDKSIGDGTLPEFLQQFDTNEDGHIDEEERQAIRDYRQRLREERRASIDTDGDGEISREEIQAAREAIRAKIEERRNTRFLEVAGEDELIDIDEFAGIPGMDRVPDIVREAIYARLDKDESGAISADEFLHRLRRHHPHGGNDEEGESEKPGKPSPPEILILPPIGR